MGLDLPTASAIKILRTRQSKMVAAAILKRTKNLTYTTDLRILTKFGVLMRLDPLHPNSQ